MFRNGVCFIKLFLLHFHIKICEIIYFLMEDSFGKYAKFSEKLTFLTPWYVNMCVYQWVRNASFSENFKDLLNGWFLTGNFTILIILFLAKKYLSSIQNKILPSFCELSSCICENMCQLWLKLARPQLSNWV